MVRDIEDDINVVGVCKTAKEDGLQKDSKINVITIQNNVPRNVVYNMLSEAYLLNYKVYKAKNYFIVVRGRIVFVIGQTYVRNMYEAINDVLRRNRPNVGLVS